jgi:hypothetical protein
MAKKIIAFHSFFYDVASTREKQTRQIQRICKRSSIAKEKRSRFKEKGMEISL